MIPEILIKAPRDLNRYLILATVSGLVALGSLIDPARAQIQRSFLNLGFEEFQINVGTPENPLSCNQYAYIPYDWIPGWRTTHPPHLTRCDGSDRAPTAPVIEIWRSGFQGRSPTPFNSLSGQQHAELNANTSSQIYQTVCIMTGDVIRWSFHHRGLSGTDTMAFKIGETEIVRASTSHTGAGAEDCRYPEGVCSSQISLDPVTGQPRTDGWRNYTGSFTWTGESGEKNFGFEAIETGFGALDGGNFIDDIQLYGLVPIVELTQAEAEGLEGEHNASNFPLSLQLSGLIETTLEIELRVVHVTTDGADVSAETVVIPIPPGTYAGTTFPIPLDILKDDTPENREQFRLEIVDKPGEGGYRAGSVSSCGAAGIVAATYTILDAHATLEKIGTFVDLVGGTAPDGTPIKNAGDRIDYEFIVTNTGDVTLTNLVLSDTIIGAPTLDPGRSGLDSNGNLPPGALAVYIASYTLTQADIDSGMKENVATLTADLADYRNESPITATSGHQEPLPHIPSITMHKEGGFDRETDDGDGLPDPGERLRFDITVTNDGNITAFNVYPDDPGPTFDGQPGTGVMSPFTPGPSNILPGETVVFTAYYTLTAEDVSYGSGLEDAVKNQASVSASDPAGAPLGASMPGPMALTMPGFGVEKRAGITQTQRGGKVPYTIVLKPLELVKPSPIRLADIMPSGFVYIPGTATVDGQPHEPTVEGRRLTWELEVEPGKDVEIQLVLGVSASAPFGTFLNLAQAERIDNDVVYRRKGRAEVEIIPEPVFDCGDITGKVFNDKNRNGYQDEGEGGIAGARVTGIAGTQITTDSHGRFSVACADLPNSRIGTNYILKLDPRSLPSGYRILSENPRVVRLTAGKVMNIDFAASITRVVRVDLSDDAFGAGTNLLLPEWKEHIRGLIAMLETEPSVLRIVYHDAGGDASTGRQRLRDLRRLITQQWREKPDRYRLEIETNVVSAGRAMLAPSDLGASPHPQ